MGPIVNKNLDFVSVDMRNKYFKNYQKQIRPFSLFHTPFYHLETKQTHSRFCLFVTEVFTIEFV